MRNWWSYDFPPEAHGKMYTKQIIESDDCDFIEVTKCISNKKAGYHVTERLAHLSWNVAGHWCLCKWPDNDKTTTGKDFLSVTSVS